jgi:sugar lactone lactonase YvrE
MTISTPEPIGSFVSKWGEGPLWHDNRLLYVDIEAHKVLSFDPASGAEKVWDVGERVGTVVPRRKGGLLIAGDNGFASVDETTGKVTPINDPEADLSTNRFNDGKCDPAGRFWAGTMHLGPNRSASGSLYIMHPDLRVEKKFGPVTVSNGLVWTKDTQKLFYIDSPRKNVIVFDFDNSTGTISNERVAFTTETYAGVPDGMTIDSEDRLWVAFCHGSALRCFDHGGRCQAEILFPVREVTACAFGGPRLEDLYVTTGTPSSGAGPLDGRLFLTRPGVKGVSAPAFAG